MLSTSSVAPPPRIASDTRVRSFVIVVVGLFSSLQLLALSQKVSVGSFKAMLQRRYEAGPRLRSAAPRWANSQFLFC